ncbi:MAG: hypothetical protein AAFO07_06840 [Bacteroidota bacterium]
MKKLQFKKHWYLGFLGLIGFYELPHVMDFFNQGASAWALLGLLWFLWFEHFSPTMKQTHR